jgi:hypothetical protein
MSNYHAKIIKIMLCIVINRKKTTCTTTVERTRTRNKTKPRWGNVCIYKIKNRK